MEIKHADQEGAYKEGGRCSITKASEGEEHTTGRRVVAYRKQCHGPPPLPFMVIPFLFYNARTHSLWYSHAFLFSVSSIFSPSYSL